MSTLHSRVPLTICTRYLLSTIYIYISFCIWGKCLQLSHSQQNHCICFSQALSQCGKSPDHFHIQEIFVATVYGSPIQLDLFKICFCTIHTQWLLLLFYISCGLSTYIAIASGRLCSDLKGAAGPTRLEEPNLESFYFQILLDLSTFDLDHTTEQGWLPPAGFMIHLLPCTSSAPLPCREGPGGESIGRPDYGSVLQSFTLSMAFPWSPSLQKRL